MRSDIHERKHQPSAFVLNERTIIGFIFSTTQRTNFSLLFMRFEFKIIHNLLLVKVQCGNVAGGKCRLKRKLSKWSRTQRYHKDYKNFKSAMLMVWHLTMFDEAFGTSKHLQNNLHFLAILQLKFFQISIFCRRNAESILTRKTFEKSTWKRMKTMKDCLSVWALWIIIDFSAALVSASFFKFAQKSISPEFNHCNNF